MNCGVSSQKKIVFIVQSLRQLLLDDDYFINREWDGEWVRS